MAEVAVAPKQSHPLSLQRDLLHKTICQVRAGHSGGSRVLLPLRSNITACFSYKPFARFALGIAEALACYYPFGDRSTAKMVLRQARKKGLGERVRSGRKFSRGSLPFSSYSQLIFLLF